jgi:hypothetical protein
MVAWALKEWQAAVITLLRGDTILLLRKGGIREARGQFSLAAQRVLLLPTTEHQNPVLLKEEFQTLAQGGAIADPVPPDRVQFNGWATITHALPLGAEAEVTRLLPYLVWNEQFVAERLNWQPDRPLYALLLRAYCFQSPVVLPHHKGYSGCRSWVETGQDVDFDAQRPVLPEAEYQDRVAAILAQVPRVTPPPDHRG